MADNLSHRATSIPAGRSKPEHQQINYTRCCHASPITRASVVLSAGRAQAIDSLLIRAAPTRVVFASRVHSNTSSWLTPRLAGRGRPIPVWSIERTPRPVGLDHASAPDSFPPAETWSATEGDEESDRASSVPLAAQPRVGEMARRRFHPGI